MSAKIGVIVSSTRPTRVGGHVADWFMAKAKEYQGLEFELLDLKEINLPFLSETESPSTGKYTQESTKQWSAVIDGLDGFIFITAEYNNGPPAPLKNAIDSIYHEWDKKPVAFVGYGTYGATRAVEQLVDNAAKVGMMPLSKTFVGLMNPWESITPEGEIKEEFVHGHIEKLLENLQWWAETLKSAREAEKTTQ